MDFKNLFITSFACFIVALGVAWSQEPGGFDTQQPGSDIASREAVGSETSIAPFGYDQLRMGSQTSLTSDLSGGAALASSEYVLGPGDVISVIIYGKGGGKFEDPFLQSSGGTYVHSYRSGGKWLHVQLKTDD